MFEFEFKKSEVFVNTGDPAVPVIAFEEESGDGVELCVGLIFQKNGVYEVSINDRKVTVSERKTEEQKMRPIDDAFKNNIKIPDNNNQSKQKKGKWKEYIEEWNGFAFCCLECSECSEKVFKPYFVCPNCKTMMEMDY